MHHCQLWVMAQNGYDLSERGNYFRFAIELQPMPNYCLMTRNKKRKSIHWQQHIISHIILFITHKNKLIERFTGTDKIKPQSLNVAWTMSASDIWRKKPTHCTQTSESFSGAYKLCWCEQSMSLELDSTFLALNCLQSLLWLYTGVTVRPLILPVLQSSKSLALFCHIHLPLTGNLLIDGWGLYGKWQDSLCRWFSFKCICHLAGEGKDERQLSWTLNRQRDTWAGDATSAGGEKRRVDDW